MTHHVALDVSLRTVNVCVMKDDGQIATEAKLPTEVEDILAYLDCLDLEVEAVGFEAGTLTQYPHYNLTAAGYEVVCMEARQVKAVLSAVRNKTDKHDTRGIAHFLRSGWYSRVHVESLESQHIRARLSSRKAVLGKCVDLENEIRALFKIFGIRLPPLMTAPGVGFFTALTFKTAIDDPSRFGRSRTVAAHLGLTPRRFQPGDLGIEGHISRCGDRDVRSELCTAANAMMTSSSKRSPLQA